MDVRIWRYMPFERFRWLVENRRLYMPQPAQLELNDNFEGTMPRAESAWWDEAVRRADTPEIAAAIKANKKKIAGFVGSFRTGWFISCWHMAEHENYAFWEIYGKESNSLAIVTTFAKLERALPEHLYLGCVRYIDYETERFEREGDLLPNLFDYIMHKRRFYSYEQEVRAVASGHAPANLGGDEIVANFVAGSYAPEIDPVEMIDQVIVHPRATAGFFAGVEEFCAEQSLPQPILSGLSSLPVQ